MKLTFSAFNEKFKAFKNDNPVKKNDYTDFIIHCLTETSVNLVRNAISQKKFGQYYKEKKELYAVPGKHAYLSNLRLFCYRNIL